MEHDPYQPISCSAYDIYEIAIMRNQCLDMHWRQGEMEMTERVRPLALHIHDGAEYLIFSIDTTDEQRQQVRLDHIINSRIVEP